MPLLGILKIGTPICVPERDFIVLGRVVGIQVRAPKRIVRMRARTLTFVSQHDKKPLEEAKKGMTVRETPIPFDASGARLLNPSLCRLQSKSSRNATARITCMPLHSARPDVSNV
jgi:hypothetical protein